MKRTGPECAVKGRIILQLWAVEVVVTPLHGTTQYLKQVCQTTTHPVAPVAGVVAIRLAHEVVHGYRPACRRLRRGHMRWVSARLRPAGTGVGRATSDILGSNSCWDGGRGDGEWR